MVLKKIGQVTKTQAKGGNRLNFYSETHCILSPKALEWIDLVLINLFFNSEQVDKRIRTSLPWLILLCFAIEGIFGMPIAIYVDVSIIQMLSLSLVIGSISSLTENFPQYSYVRKFLLTILFKKCTDGKLTKFIATTTTSLRH